MCGTVFKITTSGAESVLHRFVKPGDGSEPDGDLTYFAGELYGTTYGGGANNRGTVFKITPTGAEQVVFNFKGSDGSEPVAGLTNVDGAFYGTTANGGAKDSGTVFSLSL
jgi:uncharacterized repeat protein (TIGR03803 family)